jgi:hypothetical protein
MKHIALECGLQRPRYVRDFSKSNFEMTKEDFDDRLLTWTVCNIVIQRYFNRMKRH